MIKDLPITVLEPLAKVLQTTPADLMGWSELEEGIRTFYNKLTSIPSKDGKEQRTYYLDDATAQMAQDIKDNKELRMLFDAARDSKPEDLQTVHQMLLALKRKEKGE